MSRLRLSVLSMKLQPEYRFESYEGRISETEAGFIFEASDKSAWFYLEDFVPADHFIGSLIWLVRRCRDDGWDEIEGVFTSKSEAISALSH